MIKKIILWILVISCMGTIFFFSSQEAEDSDRVSSGFIISIVRFFDVQDTFSEAEIEEFSTALNSIVRIGAHFTIYGVLGFLIALLFAEYGFHGAGLLVYSVLSAFIYACSDELHQSFVPGRSAQLSDIVTDTLGALCGGIFAILILAIIKSIKRKNHTVQK